MNLMQTLRKLWESRKLPPSDRAAMLDPTLNDLRRRQHEDLNTLQQLAARKWLREHGYRHEDTRQ